MLGCGFLLWVVIGGLSHPVSVLVRSWNKLVELVTCSSLLRLIELFFFRVANAYSGIFAED
jgi:hypothetical protein